MPAKRYLIVNADDFGQSAGVNEGIIAAHERGIVRSASLMVRWPDAREAAAYGRGHPNFSLGLHVDLGEWTCREGSWAARYEVVSLKDCQAVADEVAHQVDSFRRLAGKQPTHLDSHQHVHRHEPVRSVLQEWARRLAIPVRQCCPQVHYCGDFYGQTTEGASSREWISVDALLRILSALPPGITELGCHPGFGQGLDSMYRAERALEVEALCDPRIRAAVRKEGIVLCSFHQVPLTLPLSPAARGRG